MNTIDCTPTWEGLVPAFIALIEIGTAEGRATAVKEITRMAQIADQAVAATKADTAMYVCAYVENHGENDMRDVFTVQECEAFAMSDYEHQLTTNPRLHAACVAKIITATEPHWTGL